MQPLLDEQRLWADGVPATNASYEGTESSDGLFKKYTLHVAYEDAVGAQHHRLVEFDTFLFGMDRDEGPEVHFALGAPDTIALGSAVHARAPRWAYGLALGAVVPLALAAALLRYARRLHREIGVRRRCALDGRPVVLELVFPRPIGVAGGKLRYDYRLRGPDGSEIRDHVECKGTHGPLFVGGRRGQTHILALRSSSSPSVILPLRDDLYPLDLPADEVGRIAAEAFDATEDIYR
jgi:hypothetical protein